jgi:hypothetical protein
MRLFEPGTSTSHFPKYALLRKGFDNSLSSHHLAVFRSRSRTNNGQAPFDDQQSWPDNPAEAVRDALTTTVQRLPKHLWTTLIWDQGKEMAKHAQFSIDIGIQVFFCDPKSLAASNH